MSELYFDTAATTPLLPAVREALLSSFDVFGNPSSLHRKGVEAEEQVRRARNHVLKALGKSSGKLVFTGAGSEANNLAIFGVAERYASRGNHLVTTAIEHPSVLESFRALERQGWSVTYVSPDETGRISAESVLNAVRDDTVLVSVMHVNNETGAIMPIEEIGNQLKGHPKLLFHVDGIQAFGKLPNGIGSVHVDLYSASGHKIGAPKGVGALYIRQGVDITPQIHGGGQEDGLRSGTENLLGIIGMGAAAEWARTHSRENWDKVSGLADVFVSGLQQLSRCRVHIPTSKSPYITSASFIRVKGEVLLHALESKGLFVSTGSACSTRGGHSKGSHVLQAMGLSSEEINGTIRFSIGAWHELTEIEHALEILKEQLEWLQSMER